MGPDLLWKVDSDVLFEPLPGSGTALSRRSSRPYMKRARFPASQVNAPRQRGLRPRKRIFMPLIVQGGKGSIEVLACPDTGSDDNIVSLELAEELGLQLIKAEERKAFVLANGKKITALGKALLHYTFGRGQGATLDTGALTCTVYVFQTLIAPALLGAAFLAENEIYTKNRHRLIEQMVPSRQALRVNSIGAPKRGLFCRLDAWVTHATADTGSDLDLVSPEFARERGFKVEPFFEELQFADGSKGTTSGVFEVSFAIGNVDLNEPFRPREETIMSLEFFVLDGLSSNVIVGEATLGELEVLDQRNDLFVPLPRNHGQSDCNPIRLIGKKEGRLRTAMESVRGFFSSREGNETGTFARFLYGICTVIDQSVDLSDVNDGNSERHRLLEIQRENARQEAIEDSGSKLPLLLSNIPSPPNSPTSHAHLNHGENIPDSNEHYPDQQSTADSPFFTGDLVESHMSTHASSRPHYCPISGCPRSKGGRGFKRKNEMIRHRIVHDSPGYICPFCPDRELRYPRPDNLQR